MRGKKLWCFGDSFTAGSGLTSKNYTRDHFDNKYAELIWPKLLATKNSFDLELHCRGGASNEEIGMAIAGNLIDIQKDDQVIIGTSLGDRIPVLQRAPVETLGGKSWVVPTNASTMVGLARSGIYSFDLEKSIYFLSDAMAANGQTIGAYTSVLLTRLGVYIAEKITPNVVIWGPDRWPEYETITQATKGKIKDIHWSVGGHEKFAAYLQDRLFKGLCIDEHLYNWRDTMRAFHRDELIDSLK